jgi:hypothetical protein
MGRRSRTLLASVVIASFMLVAATSTGAQEAVQVTKLRTPKVALYDKPNGAKVLDYGGDKFKGPWPVLGSSPEGFLHVEVEGKRYWVRAYAVETNRPIRTSADCGAVVASRQPKAGATRGIGEECQK